MGEDPKPLEKYIGRKLAIVHDYTDWSGVFPTAHQEQQAAGRILFVDWTARDYGAHAPAASWAQIASGAQDGQINAEAAALKAFGQPIMVTFQAEPEQADNDVYGGSSDYVAAWQHIHDVFADDGVTNVVWVWDVMGDVGAHQAGFYSHWYPGDNYVDWIMWDPYNWYGCKGGNPPWETFSDIATPMYDWLTENSGKPGNGDYLSKPWGLAEFGSTEGPTPNSKEQWLENVVTSAQNEFPNLKALVYFDSDDTTHGRDCRWVVDSSANALSGYTAAGDNPYASAMPTPGGVGNSDVPPAITENPQSQTVPSGRPVFLRAAAIGRPRPSVHWETRRGDHGQWWPMDGHTSSTYRIGSATESDSGEEFRAVYTNLEGRAFTTAATVRVTSGASNAKKPRITEQPKSERVRVGHSVRFIARATGRPKPWMIWQLRWKGGHKWWSPRQLNSGAYRILSVIKADNGLRVRALFRNDAGSTTSQAATVTVIPQPKRGTRPRIVQQPKSESVSVGQPLQLTARAAGRPKPSVEWELRWKGGHQWLRSRLLTSKTVRIHSATMADNGLAFRAIFQNKYGVVESRVATVTVRPRGTSATVPRVTLEPQSVLVPVGSRIRIVARATGRPTPRVMWQLSGNAKRPWTPVPNQTSRVFTIRAATMADNGLRVRAVFRNGHGVVQSSVARITVRPRAAFAELPRVIEQPKSVHVALGSRITLMARGAGSPKPRLHWQFSRNGGRTWRWLRQQTKPALTIPSANIADNGLEVRAVFRNRHGMTRSEAARITVRLWPSASSNTSVAPQIPWPLQLATFSTQGARTRRHATAKAR